MQYFCSLDRNNWGFFSLHYLSLTNSSRKNAVFYAVIINIFLFLSWGTGRGIGVYTVGGSPCGWRIYSLSYQKIDFDELLQFVIPVTAGC